LIAAFIIGKYTLSLKDDGFVYLENEDGEGMECNKGKLEDMLKKFFNDNF